MIFQDQCIKAIEAILNTPLDYKCGTVALIGWLIGCIFFVLSSCSAALL